MKLPAKLNIFRRTSNMEPEYFVIEVMDVASGIEAVRVHVSPADLALALSGRAFLPVDAEWAVDHLGKRAETKTEFVPFDGGANGQKRRAALKPFEVDGWTGDVEDLGNRHRRAGDGYLVTFRRWVAS